MRALHTLLLSVIVLISACTGTTTKQDRQPDWINSPSQHHPTQLYLTGQGSADNLNDAKDRARADLAKQFEVAINEHSLQQQQYNKQQQDEKSSEAFQQKISRQLITQTTRTVQGIEITDSWHDKTHHKYYALAVLSRNKAKQGFEQQIKTFDQQSKQKLKQAESETDKLKKTSLVQHAIDAQIKRQSMQSALQVIDTSGRGQPASISLAELIRTRNSLLSSIILTPHTNGALAQQLQTILSSNSANAGFQINTNAKSDYTLNAELKLESPLTKNQWHWLRGTLEIRLLDNNSNNLGLQRWPLKAASVTNEQTEQRLLSDINDILKKELRTTVLAFGAND